MHSRRRHLWHFATLAVLVHVFLILIITIRQVYEGPEPALSSKFIKRRPLRQPVLERRLVAIYSLQNYRDFWSKRPERAIVQGTLSPYRYNGYPLHRPTSEPAIRLGINIVVYALTQAGSLARRYVQPR